MPTKRAVYMFGSDIYDLKYDAENRLVEVKKNSTVIATFGYDGDGKQVKSIINGVTTYYVGAYYQKEGTVVTKYYYAGGERVAMRQGGVLYHIFGDHLGSTAVVKSTQGNKTELRYTAWGTTRYEYGTTPTDRRYTGQREEASFGLYFYNARWYDPAIGRFIQADTIVPGAGNPQAWDRYAYANNNPLNYTDPTGHWVESLIDIAFITYDVYNISKNGLNWENGLSLAADVAGLALPLVTGGGLLVRAATHADDAIDTIKVIDQSVEITNALDNIADVGKLPLENHHFLPNKNSKYTKYFEEIAQKYGLDLDDIWNIKKMPQRGRHPNDHHEWALERIQEIDKGLSGCRFDCAEKFVSQFQEEIIKPVLENPSMLRKEFWMELFR